jgi:hypothetical protein
MTFDIYKRVDRKSGVKIQLSVHIFYGQRKLRKPNRANTDPPPLLETTSQWQILAVFIIVRN